MKTKISIMILVLCLFCERAYSFDPCEGWKVPYSVNFLLKNGDLQKGYVFITTNLLCDKASAQNWFGKSYLSVLKNLKIKKIDLFLRYKYFCLQLPRRQQWCFLSTDGEKTSIDISEVKSCEEIEDPVNGKIAIEEQLQLPKNIFDMFCTEKIAACYKYRYKEGDLGGVGYLVSFNKKIHWDGLEDIFLNKTHLSILAEKGDSKKRDSLKNEILKKYKVVVLEFPTIED